MATGLSDREVITVPLKQMEWWIERLGRCHISLADGVYLPPEAHAVASAYREILRPVLTDMRTVWLTARSDREVMMGGEWSE